MGWLERLPFAVKLLFVLGGTLLTEFASKLPEGLQDAGAYLGLTLIVAGLVGAGLHWSKERRGGSRVEAVDLIRLGAVGAGGFAIILVAGILWQRFGSHTEKQVAAKPPPAPVQHGPAPTNKAPEKSKSELEIERLHAETELLKQKRLAGKDGRKSDETNSVTANATPAQQAAAGGPQAVATGVFGPISMGQIIERIRSGLTFPQQRPDTVIQWDVLITAPPENEKKAEIIFSIVSSALPYRVYRLRPPPSNDLDAPALPIAPNGAVVIHSSGRHPANVDAEDPLVSQLTGTLGRCFVVKTTKVMHGFDKYYPLNEPSGYRYFLWIEVGSGDLIKPGCSD